MSTPPPISDDRASQLVRLRQYLTPNLPVAFVISAVMLGLGVQFDSRILVIYASLPFIMGLVYIWALQRVRHGKLEGAIFAISVGLAFIPIIVTLVVPQAFAVAVVIPVWSVVLALPYVTGRRLAPVIAVASLSAIGAAAASLLPAADVYPLTESILTTLFAAVTPILTGMIFLLVWQYSSRLTETLTKLRRANEALQESERSLEAKVHVRTAELAEARDQALEASRYLTAVIDNLAEGLLVTDITGRITHSNPALANMFDLGEEQLVGQPCQEMFRGPVSELISKTSSHPTQVLTAEVELSGGAVGMATATAILKDGQVGPENRGNQLGSVVLVRDITAERQIDQMKTEFLSTVSHELRTPLTSVLGFARINQKRLEERIIPAVRSDEPRVLRAIEQVRSNTKIILAEGERLTTLINDVLDLAKIEAGRVEWDMRPLQVGEVFERAISGTSSLFEDRDLKLIKRIDEELPQIVGDKNRLIQVLVNLISNAVKFTPRGSVTVRAARTNGELQISVVDTGVGISPSDQAKVFEKFKQAGDTLTEKPAGTGLGLPICKEIIEHHGGRIWVESKAGQGSTFAFTLPIPTEDDLQEIKPVDLDTMLRQLTQQVVSTTPTSAEQQRTILVVDDEASIRELLDQELTAAGYRVHLAEDGRVALATIKSQLPDLVILDVKMPEISGFDVAAVLKNDPRTMGVPIIILSIVEDQERGYKLGVDRYLTKPFETEDLLKEVESVLAKGRSKKKVLVVDQDASTIRTLSDALQTHGYSVVEASSDDELMEKAVADRPDMIIVNAMFSQQRDVVRALRFEKGLENVVVLLYQASGGAESDE